MIYRLFFAEVVTGFLQSMIAAKVTLMVPVLPAVDPTGRITDWIAETITSVIPIPRQGRHEHGAGPSLADLGRRLIEEAVEQALRLHLTVFQATDQATPRASGSVRQLSTGTS